MTRLKSVTGMAFITTAAGPGAIRAPAIGGEYPSVIWFDVALNAIFEKVGVDEVAMSCGVDKVTVLVPRPETFT